MQGKETIILLNIEKGVVLVQRFKQRLTSGEEELKIAEVETGIFCDSFPLKIKPACAE